MVWDARVVLPGFLNEYLIILDYYNEKATNPIHNYPGFDLSNCI